ncbi:MAG: ATP-binding cassette domain-containing protein [bacterium]|nr:ATP-binding cassette domain-containing protein [bacterium]
MTVPVARLLGVSKSFGRGPTLVQALAEVSLDVLPGELTLIEGPSGSGKTTLLHILGLLQRPDRGEVWVSGIRTDALAESRLPERRRGRVALIFQGYNLLESLTVSDNIALAGALTPRRFGPAAVDDCLVRLGMKARARHLPAELSGGEKQRTSIGRALASGGSLILADEPTANLDWENAQDVMQHLADLVRVEGKAVVMVSHDSRLEPYADRIVGLLNGRISSDRRIPRSSSALRRVRQGQDAEGDPGDRGRRDQDGEHPRPKRPLNLAATPPRGRVQVAGVLGILLLLALAVVVALRYFVPFAPTASESTPSQQPVAAAPYVAAAPAVVEPSTHLVAIRAERRGRIKAVLKQAGERIVRGEPLVLLDDVVARAMVDQRRADTALAEADLDRLKAWDRPEARAKAAAGVERAQARLDRAEQELTRIQGLYERTAAPEKELQDAIRDRRAAAAALEEVRQISAIAEAGPMPEEIRVAEAKVEQAKTAVRLTEAELALRTITSPLDGHVVYRHLEPGEVVDPEHPVPILSVGNLDEVRLRAEVDEADITRVRLAQRVVATAEAFGDREFTGRVVHLEPMMGRKSIRTQRTTERQDTKVREVLIEVDRAGAELPIDLQMTVRFLKSETRTIPAKPTPAGSAAESHHEEEQRPE